MPRCPISLKTLFMIHSKQGWLFLPARLLIAIGIAYLLSQGINGPNSKLDLAFLKGDQTQSTVEQESPKSAQPTNASLISLPNKVGLSASVALVLYVWIAYEWVGFARFTKACQRLKTLGAKIRFKDESSKPFYHYYFRSETSVDLSKKQLRDEHFQLLGQLPNVIALHLENANPPNNLVQCLKKLKRLKKLDVKGIALTDLQRKQVAKLLVR